MNRKNRYKAMLDRELVARRHRRMRSINLTWCWRVWLALQSAHRSRLKPRVMVESLLENPGYLEWGSDPDKDNPWAKRFDQIPRHSRRRPRVLVAARGGNEYRAKQASQLLQKYGLVNPEIVHSVSLSEFWPNFFACRNFVGEPKRCQLPALILTSGELRHYDDWGAKGHTFSGLASRIQEVGKRWNIPVELIQRAPS